MYSKHCHFIPEGGGDEILAKKLNHLPTVGMYVKMKPLSTGVETEYEVEKVTLVMEEVTTNYPAPPGAASVTWERKWEIELSVV